MLDDANVYETYAGDVPVRAVLPDDLHHQTPDDDLYLLQTAINTKDKLILTTDERLKEKLSAWQELNIHLVDEFLQKYDC